MKRTTFFSIVLCVLNLFLVAVVLLLFYWNGYARDNGIYRSQNLQIIICLLIIISIGLFILGSCKYKKWNRKISLCNVFLIFLGFVVIAMWLNSDNVKMKIPSYYSFADRVKASRVVEISLAELQEVIESNDDVVLYIGRNSCPSCEEFYPRLEEWSYEANFFVLYYNTEPDRIERKHKMRRTLEEINVFTVPSVVIRNDETYYVFDEDITKEDIIKVCYELQKKK